MDRQKNRDIFALPVNGRNQILTRNKYIAAAAATIVTLSACWPSQLSDERFEQEAAAMTVRPGGSDPKLEFPNVSTTALDTTIPLEPSTTTTLPEAVPVKPTNSHDYIPNDCDQGDTLRVNITGQGGVAINAQVSVDYMLGDQKVDVSGNPIAPYEGYSDYVYINQDVPAQGSMDGLHEVCFQNIPHGASVYVEAYSLSRVEINGADVRHIATEEYYGHTMSHQLWPGNGQIVYLRQPSVCGIGGTAGSIMTNIRAEDGSVLMSNRIAAWDTGQKGRSGFAFGFGVEDVVYNGTKQENTLNTLMSDRSYSLQVQSKDQNGGDTVFVIRDVPVEACKETEVSISKIGESCLAVVGDKQLDCTLNKEFIG